MKRRVTPSWFIEVEKRERDHVMWSMCVDRDSFASQHKSENEYPNEGELRARAFASALRFLGCPRGGWGYPKKDKPKRSRSRARR